MSVMYVIVPLALLVVLAAVAAYLWAAHQGQFDDLDTPALRALHDEPEDGPSPPSGDRQHSSPHNQRPARPPRIRIRPAPVGRRARRC
ncbi:MAG TPA: cbb3-type cytochrome oxidase assembly protein CcoS [Candidatus Sulfotelmatobacter sp.]|nr:cbb3-type cytochrome oxidase assembly protein CcoS [Candidatus Sulfotelmatobacter sp.]